MSEDAPTSFVCFYDIFWNARQIYLGAPMTVEQAYDAAMLKLFGKPTYALKDELRIALAQLNERVQCSQLATEHIPLSIDRLSLRLSVIRCLQANPSVALRQHALQQPMIDTSQLDPAA